MSDDHAALIQRVDAWAADAAAAGWLNEADLAAIAQIERATPADLFAGADPARPLVVAFFGGTGVGKSSLLNRLAGAAIARVGVERPTSHELTLYLHADAPLAALPPALVDSPLRVHRHHADRFRDVLWIDAPDIDSTHERNRELVFAWLPHIDLLIYVVSPERYRDDVGWRVLRRRGERHGWFFVVNRWDEGDPAQRAQFEQMLRDAGFETPLLFTTCCAGASPPSDEFDALVRAIDALAASHAVAEFERLGHRARWRDLATALRAALEKLPDEAHWSRVRDDAAKRWQETRAALRTGTDFAMRTAAARLAQRSASAWTRWWPPNSLSAAAAHVAAHGAPNGVVPAHECRGAPTNAPEPLDDAIRSLWDDWSHDRVRRFVDAVEIEARRGGGACGRLRPALDESSATLENAIIHTMQDGVRRALSAPGTRLQRSLRRATGFLTAFMPAAALAWVAYELVHGYYRASIGAAPYHGTPFAIHSALLVLVAWALPFAADRLLRPALDATALRALRASFDDALGAAGARWTTALDSARREAERLRAAAAALLHELDSAAARRIPVAPGAPGASDTLRRSVVNTVR
ncbi:MAG: hypothetical protein AB7Q17_18660 [Phycisphaerae bacterium]